MERNEIERVVPEDAPGCTGRHGDAFKRPRGRAQHYSRRFCEEFDELDELGNPQNRMFSEDGHLSAAACAGVARRSHFRSFGLFLNSCSSLPRVRCMMGAARSRSHRPTQHTLPILKQIPAQFPPRHSSTRFVWSADDRTFRVECGRPHGPLCGVTGRQPFRDRLQAEWRAPRTNKSRQRRIFKFFGQTRPSRVLRLCHRRK